jgi:hypothetical protein
MLLFLDLQGAAIIMRDRLRVVRSLVHMFKSNEKEILVVLLCTPASPSPFCLKLSHRGATWRSRFARIILTGKEAEQGHSL